MRISDWSSDVCSSDLQNVVEHLIALGVDDGDAVGRAEGDVGLAAIGEDAHSHRLQGLGLQPRYREGDLLLDLEAVRIDDADRAADLGGHPHLCPVVGILGDARALVDQHVALDLESLGVDEVRHVGGFGGVHDGLAVGADAHALGLDADRNLRDGGTALEVYHGHQVVVRSEEHTSELQSLMRISYAVFCLKKKNNKNNTTHTL